MPCQGAVHLHGIAAQRQQARALIQEQCEAETRAARKQAEPEHRRIFLSTTSGCCEGAVRAQKLVCKAREARKMLWPECINSF